MQLHCLYTYDKGSYVVRGLSQRKGSYDEGWQSHEM